MQCNRSCFEVCWDNWTLKAEFGTYSLNVILTQSGKGIEENLIFVWPTMRKLALLMTVCHAGVGSSRCAELVEGKQGGQETIPHGKVANHHDSALRGTYSAKRFQWCFRCVQLPLGRRILHSVVFAVLIFFTFHLPTCIDLLRFDPRGVSKVCLMAKKSCAHSSHNGVVST